MLYNKNRHHPIGIAVEKSLGRKSNKSMFQAQNEAAAPDGASNPSVKHKTLSRRLLKIILTLCGAGFIIIIMLASYFFIPRNTLPGHPSEFAQTWRLVPEKISKSAAVRVYAPAGMTSSELMQQIKFNPEIDGHWLSPKTGFFNFINIAYGQNNTANYEYAEYQPDYPLEEGLHYQAILTLADNSQISADFLAVSDPQIDAIFPKNEMEAPEDSKITIVFGRPMVALSTADMMEPKNLPVKITPETNGKWKWISTNTLQFIPDNSLMLSSNYQVKVEAGLKSIDGLALAPAQSFFKTRSLRYLDDKDDKAESDEIDEIIYSQPYRIYFNQPVDLEKTMAQIKVLDTTAGKEIEFIAQYKKIDKKNNSISLNSSNIDFLQRIKLLAANYYNKARANLLKSSNDSGAEEDKSIIEIYAQQDKFGRKKYWNTSNSYSITIKKAYPAEGDIIIDGEKQIKFSTTGLVDEFFESDGRSDYNSEEMFDPQGKLGIRFYEDVDLEKSKLSASAAIVKKEYGKKCSDPDLYPDDVNCVKIDDAKTILLTFDQSLIKAGQIITLHLEKIVNSAGDQINSEVFNKDINVYKPLQFYVARRDGVIQLNNLILCSNNPLAVPDKENLNQSLKSDLEFELFLWGESRQRTKEASDSYQNPVCKIGEFETKISVGLIPSRTYSFGITVSDVFGQVAASNFELATEAMKNLYTDLFAMQQESSITTSDRTKLTYGSKNLPYVNISICKLDAYDFWQQKQRLRQWSERKSNPYPQNCQETVQQQMSLPERYWLTNYFDVNAVQGFGEPLGNYIVTISSPQFTDYDGKMRYLTSFVTVTNLSAAQKAVRLSDYLYDGADVLTNDQLSSMKNIYWVSNLKTLAPLAGAEVTVYSKNAVVGKALTDDKGIAMINPVAGADLAVVRYGNDSTVIAGDDTQMNYTASAYNVRRAYIYSDRPIYRPGDKINIKGILRLGYDGNYQMWDNKNVAIEIRGPSWDTIAAFNTSANEYGTFTAEYNLDNAAALGNYQICVKNSSDCGNFSVKEYAPAAFKIEASSAKDEYISQDKIKIDLNAQYYFGVPVANADVEYTISSQNYYFDKYSEGGWNFGFYSDDCFGKYCYGDKFISRGTLKLDGEGKGAISQTIDLQKIAAEDKYAASRIVVFDITAKNSLGQAVSTQKSIIVHAGEIYLGVKTNPFFAQKGQKVALEAQAVDTQGKKFTADNVLAAIYKVEWVQAKRQEAGGYYNYDWTKKRNLINTIDLNSKGNGLYTADAVFDREGEYEIDFTGKDKRGIIIMSRSYVYVYGQGIASIRFYDDNQLTFKAQKENLNAGEQGSLIIESPFAKAKALITIERGKVFKYDIVDVIGSMYEYKFTAIDEYAPNVYVSVLLQSADPVVKFGTQEFKINSDIHKLNIEVSSDKKIYKPGEKVTLKFYASDWRNQPVSADISAAVVDVSVLALAGNPKKDPLIFFYDGLPLTVNTSSNLKEALVKVEKESLTKGGSGGGGNDKDNSVRGEFRDTALWQGRLITDNSGRAEITFNLPDNLTTWQAEAIGVSYDTKLGAGYAQFMSKNDLMVVPLKPRFIIPGDKFYIAAQVFNQSDKSRGVKISFDSDTLKFIDGSKKIKINLDSGGSKTVYFHIAAPSDQTQGIHTFTISADGSGISDVIRQSIPVVPNLTYETVATANYVDRGSAAEAIYLPGNVLRDQGGLTVRSSATLAVFLSDALNYFIAYPYGCTEQISSRLKAMAIVKKGLNIPNLADKFKLDDIWIDDKKYSIDDLIDIGLNKIYRNQCANGGYGMWDSRQDDYYATLQAVSMLATLKSAGVNINQASFNRALDYLNSQFNSKTITANPNQITMIASALLSQNSQVSYSENARAAIINLLAPKTRAEVLGDQLSNHSLAQLAIILSRQDFADALSDINAVLDNRITIDSRGAFLRAKSEQSFDRDDYETTIGDTALYLRALAIQGRDTVYTDKIVRWLLQSRDRDGAWGSTQNTLAVVEAFVDFLNWKRETESSFTLTTAFNGEQISQKEFNAQTILDQSIARVPASQFKDGINNLVFSQNKNSQGGFYYDIDLKYYLNGLVGPRDEGFSVARAFYSLDDENGKNVLISATPGQVLREHLEITVGRDRRFAAIEDYIPAGMEIVDMELATEQKALRLNDPLVKYNLLRPDYTELRDDRAFIYVSDLPAGTYEFDYYVRALAKGDYLQLPCVVSEFYNPENFGRTASSYFTIQ